MDTLRVIVGASNIVVGLLLIGVSLPLVKGRIKRNASYGFRFPESLASEDAWLAINRYGARRLIVWSIPLVVWGLAILVVPHQWTNAELVIAANAPLVVLVPCVECWRFARRYRASP